MVDIKPGDVLAIWNMPYIVPSYIIKIVSGAHCDHMAISLDGMIYEATPPAVRKMPIADYVELLGEYAKKRKWFRDRFKRKLKCEVWHNESISDDAMARMLKYAESMLGTPYSMVWNYLFETDAVHCAEFCARALDAGGLVNWDVEPSKIEPMDVREALRFNGWTHSGDIVP